MSPQDLKNVISQLMSAQTQTNCAIESLSRNSSCFQSVMQARFVARQAYSQKLVPLFQKIQSINDSDPMSTGQIAVQNLMITVYTTALDLIAQEKQITAEVSINSAFASDRSSQHPLGSLLDLFTNSTTPESYTDATTDIPQGQQAMQYFYNKAETYPTTDLPLNFDQFVSTINQKSPAFFSGLGLAIRSIGLSDSQVQAAMEQMANQGQGHMPANWNIFFSAVGQAGENPSFWSAIQFVAWNTAQTVIQDTSVAGKSILTGVQGVASLAAYLPWILIGGAALYIYTNSKSLHENIKSKFKDIHEGVKRHLAT